MAKSTQPSLLEKDSGKGKDSPHAVPAVSDEITSAFSQVQNKNEIAEVLKELFDTGKIYLITDLTNDEIKLMTRIYMIAEMKGIQAWKDGIFIYSQLLLSKKRKSRTELISAMQGLQQQRGIFSRLFNRQDRGMQGGGMY